MYAKARVSASYERDGQLLTEHAMLDDNGDGKGTDTPGQPGGDGALARTQYLSGGATAETVADSPELRALLDQRSVLEDAPGRPEGRQSVDGRVSVRTRPRSPAARTGARRPRDPGEAHNDPRVVAWPLAVSALAGSAAVLAVQQQPPPEVRLPAIQFPAAPGRHRSLARRRLADASAVWPDRRAGAAVHATRSPAGRRPVLEPGQVRVRRLVRLRASAVHRRCQRRRTGRRPGIRPPVRPWRRPALVARLSAGRAQLHEDPRRDHDRPPLHGTVRRRDSRHRVEGALQVPGRLHGRGRVTGPRPTTRRRTSART